MISSVSSSVPPQTYSRLFRPWDGKSSSQEDPKDIDKRSATENDLISKSNKWKISDKKINFQFDECETNGLQYNDLNKTIVSPNDFSTMDTAATSLFYSSYSEFLATGAPYLGIDPFAASTVEQEYARVLAEEAQAKMLSARKQRPKKFKCPHCDVAFSNNGQLKGHVRIHTGERPFKCEEVNCGKTFTRNEELTRHKRIHTGLRPYACNTCGKRFGRRDHLKKHTKTHFIQERYLAPTMFLPIYPYLYGY